MADSGYTVSIEQPDVSGKIKKYVYRNKNKTPTVTKQVICEPEEEQDQDASLERLEARIEQGALALPESKQAPEIVKRMDFKNGKNKVTIALVKKDKRMFSVKIFLNDETEIKSATIQGLNSANTFWDFMERSIK